MYERARPGYPDEAVAWVAERLGIGPGRDVLDLAAGTGKLTRQLVPLGARIVAVEPIDAMRAQLERVVPASKRSPAPPKRSHSPTQASTQSRARRQPLVPGRRGRP